MIQDHDDVIVCKHSLDQQMTYRAAQVVAYDSDYGALNHCTFELSEGCLTIAPRLSAPVRLGPNNTQHLLNELRAASRMTAGLPAEELTPEEAVLLPEETRPWPAPMKDDFEDDVVFFNICDTYAHVAFQRNKPDEEEEELRMCFDNISLRLLAARCLMAAEYIENKRLSIPYEQ